MTLVTLCVMALAVAILFLLYSPFFSARTIWVQGSPYLSKQQVLSVAQVSEATPLFDVNPGHVSALLERDPWIEKATVSVLWPSKILIRVREAKPVGFLQLTNGSDVIVGSNGKVLSSPPAASGLPRFVLPSGLSPQKASAERLPSSLLTEDEIMTAMPNSLTGYVKNIHYLNALGAELVLQNGTDVVFGNSFNLREKWIALATMITKTNINKDREIDLRDPNLPVVTQ